MISMKKLLTFACLTMTVPALTAAAAEPKSTNATPGKIAPLSGAERYARRCQHQAPSRDHNPQGTMLWGTKQGWSTRPAASEQSSVLTSADLGPPRLAEGVKALALEGGHLVATGGAAAEKGAPATARSVVGTVLQGAASDGQPVEVAICDADASAGDAGMVWYHIEAWNPVAQDWENPCVPTGRVPNPRALALGGVWDASGAHRDTAGKLTFACENGVLAKCVSWGYKPWASRNGRSLADLHQACTRMARADYCGNGRSHTREGTMIDYYDSAGVSSRTTETSEAWDPARGSLEAAWAPDGATCLSHTRDGRELSTILQECPGRFRAAEMDLGQGDRCAVQRTDVSPAAAPLRNRSYGGQKTAAGK